ncbi:hypothetical protein [Flagellimonas zhangzhouensis]|uniref:hypothetical protein n=1 Tax=Flagellimonas zhangzhouensis TaxID=1073328 RepID=UPI000B7E51EB|nr:hypothetical protein [Allomuricauda zhangzhouensis]
MKFNWLFSGDDNPVMKRTCIDLEYKLRPKITKFLLSKLDSDYSGDLSRFCFDVDVDRKWVSISDKTPKELISKIWSDFDAAINGSPFPSVA